MRSPGASDSDADYGYGAFLLAGSELLRMLGGVADALPDAGPDRFILAADGNQVDSVVLDASSSLMRRGEAIEYSWWEGTTLLGVGKQAAVDLPRGVHSITLELIHSDGNIYADNCEIEIAAPRLAVTASGSENEVNLSGNTLDGDASTRWSQEGRGEWIEYALPDQASLDSVQIAFFRGDERQPPSRSSSRWWAAPGRRCIRERATDRAWDCRASPSQNRKPAADGSGS